MRGLKAAGDRGAVALIVAIVVPVLLLGIGALIIDVGSWYAARAMDQNAADAGVMAIANTCYPGPCNITAANTYANGAANGKLAGQVYEVCGSVSTTPLTILPTCASVGVPEDGKACPLAPSTDYVDVLAAPKNADKSPTLLSFFGYGKQKVGACAQAVPSAIGGGTGLALTMSLCAWQQETGTQNPNASPKFATPQPPYPADGWPAAYPFGAVSKKNPVQSNPGGENVVQVHGDAKPCNDSSSGLNIPGGFGWLADPTATCTATTTAGGYVLSDPGTNISNPCKTALNNIYDASDNNQTIPNSLNPVFVPIFDSACNSNGYLDDGSGKTSTPCPVGMPNSSYHIIGYAAFVLTGADVNPVHLNSLITNKPGACNGGSFTCLYGLFTKTLVASTTTPCTSSCTSYGAISVRLSG